MSNVHPINMAIYPVAELLPHTGTALLLDTLIAHDKDWIESAVHHKKQTLYTDINGNTPVWVGIEYMVQTIGLFAGLEARRDKQQPKLGFLLGTRTFTAHVDFFPANKTVHVRADMLFRDDSNIVLFACSIRDSDSNLLADAEIKAIQPDNIDDILKEHSHG